MIIFFNPRLLIPARRCSLRRFYFSGLKNNYSEKDNEETVKKNPWKQCMIYGVLGYTLYNWMKESSFVPKIYAKSIHTTNNLNNRDKYNFIADVVKIAAPSVVFIEIKDAQRVDFFTGRSMTASNGSGFIIEENGLILTNAHVVVNKPNSSIQVRLQDGTVHTAEVEEVDMQSDLAIIRIQKGNLPVMKLGTSTDIRPGEFVVAIGSPLSLNNSITCGVVSSANRQSQELGLHHKHMQYIQTDAAITFGNSGGPLVNLDGEAIGINAMKVTAGISFAIPIDYAKEFLKSVEARKQNKGSKVDSKRRYIGITMLTLTPDILFELQQRGEKFPLHISHGVMVWKVVTGSPAEKGGLKPEDVITHVNEESIISAGNVYQALEKTGPINVTVLREGKVLNVRVSPEEIH